MSELTIKLKKAVKQLVSSFDNRIIIQPEQYDLLFKSHKNRTIKPNHVKTMKNSVLRHGVLRLVIVVHDVQRGLYHIIDGQHLIAALKELKRSIECVVVNCDTEEQMTQLMIDLNNISKSWGLNDYIHSWAESGLSSYRDLRFISANSDIQVSVIASAYAQKHRLTATKEIKEGTFKITNKTKGDEIMNNILLCHKFVENSRPINEALVRIMITTDNYNNNQMLKNLQKKAKKTNFSSSEKLLVKQLIEIYEK